MLFVGFAVFKKWARRHLTFGPALAWSVLAAELSDPRCPNMRGDKQVKIQGGPIRLLSGCDH